jgi:hypothetical protein
VPTFEQKLSRLRTWLKYQETSIRRQGRPVTADELIAKIKKNWPTTSNEDVDRLYQEIG